MLAAGRVVYDGSPNGPAAADVLAAVSQLDRSMLKGKRDAALLLVGFSTALRRSELVALELEDLFAARMAVLRERSTWRVAHHAGGMATLGLLARLVERAGALHAQGQPGLWPGPLARCSSFAAPLATPPDRLLWAPFRDAAFPFQDLNC